MQIKHVNSYNPIHRSDFAASRKRAEKFEATATATLNEK